MKTEHIVFRNKEIVCLHCEAEQTVIPLKLSQMEVACEPFIEEHKNCKKVKKMNWNEFKSNVELWAEERGIYEHSTPEAQLLKALSELGELADAVVKNDRDGLKDAIGDVAVCLVNYARMAGADELYLSEFIRRMERRETVEVIGNICISIGLLLSGERHVYIPQLIQNYVCEVARNEGLDFMSCCAAAWNEIKDRKGRMVSGGAFVKDE